MYPLHHVFREIVKKNFDKKMVALPPSGYQRKHFEYENLDYDEWRERHNERAKLQGN